MLLTRHTENIQHSSGLGHCVELPGQATHSVELTSRGSPATCRHCQSLSCLSLDIPNSSLVSLSSVVHFQREVLQSGAQWFSEQININILRAIQTEQRISLTEMSGNPGGGKGSSLPTGAGLPVSAPNQNRVLPTPAATLPNPMAAIAAPQAAPASDLASLFECPVCFDYVLPPILQCHAGHLVCSNCRPKLTCCPTCRGQLGGNIRNLAMEKVASTVMFPCKYSSGGCAAQLLHTDKVSPRGGSGQQ